MRPLTSTPSTATRAADARAQQLRHAEGAAVLAAGEPESCEASTAKADATASVIMAKKIARTRSENRPITSASTSGERQRDDRARPAIAPQRRAQRVQRDRRRRSRRCRRTSCARTRRCRCSRAAGRSSPPAAMKTQILAATLSGCAPGNRNGASARPTRIDQHARASTRLRGGSPESSASAASSLAHRIEPARPPQQDQHHQQDVGAQRDLRHQEAGVVGQQRRPAARR